MADTVSFDDLLGEVESVGPPKRQVVHALRAVSLVGSATGLPITLQRGDTLEVTEQLRQWNTSRTGQCALDNPGTFARGSAPSGMLPPVGSPEFEDEARAAYERAWRIQDDAGRRAALAQVHDRYGRLESAKSRTLRTFS